MMPTWRWYLWVVVFYQAARRQWTMTLTSARRCVSMDSWTQSQQTQRYTFQWQQGWCRERDAGVDVLMDNNAVYDDSCTSVQTHMHAGYDPSQTHTGYDPSQTHWGVSVPTVWPKINSRTSPGPHKYFPGPCHGPQQRVNIKTNSSYLLYI